MTKAKKFDACLIRSAGDEFVVAEWDQLVTVADKHKLGIGSNVGFKRSANKRDKIIRGTIAILGSKNVCEEQKNLLQAPHNYRNTKQKTCFETNDQNNNTKVVADSKNASDSDDDNSSDSTNKQLIIDADQESITEKSNAEKIPLNDPVPDTSANEPSLKSPNDSSSLCVANEIDKTRTCNNRNIVSDDEIEHINPGHRPVSTARYDILRMENNRLKKEIDKYKNEWMPRPKDANVIKYFVRMGELLSNCNDHEEDKGEKLHRICEKLNMNEEQLSRLQKSNGTKTARSIIRAYYPLHTRVEVLDGGIDENVRQAVHDYIHIFHSMEGLTSGQINESINNVFRSARSQQKKDEVLSSQPSTSNSVNLHHNNKPNTNKQSQHRQTHETLLISDT